MFQAGSQLTKVDGSPTGFAFKNGIALRNIYGGKVLMSAVVTDLRTGFLTSVAMELGSDGKVQMRFIPDEPSVNAVSEPGCETAENYFVQDGNYVLRQNRSTGAQWYLQTDGVRDPFSGEITDWAPLQMAVTCNTREATFFKSTEGGGVGFYNITDKSDHIIDLHIDSNSGLAAIKNLSQLPDGSVTFTSDNGVSDSMYQVMFAKMRDLKSYGQPLGNVNNIAVSNGTLYMLQNEASNSYNFQNYAIYRVAVPKQ